MRRAILLACVAAVCVLAVAALAADKAKPKAPKTPIAQAQEDIDSLKDDVRHLADDLKSLRQEITDLKAGKKTLPQGQIDDALRRGKIAVGMTVDQVAKVAGGKGNVVSDGKNGSVHEWVLSSGRKVIDGDNTIVSEGSYRLTCIFQDGRLVSFDRINLAGGGAKEFDPRRMAP